MRVGPERVQEENAVELEIVGSYIFNNVRHILDYYSPVLGEFELLVLLSLVHLGNGAYGAAIHRDLAERAGRHASAGTLYMTLTRLEAKKMIVSYEGPPIRVRGGRRRKHFLLAQDGERALGRAWRALRRMTAGLEGQLDAF